MEGSPSRLLLDRDRGMMMMMMPSCLFFLIACRCPCALCVGMEG